MDDRKIFDAFEKVCKASPVSAWSVVDSSGEWVATIVAKYPRDGMGRLYAYIMTNDSERNRTMSRGYASGCGYDKLAAALDGQTIRDKDGNTVTFCDHGKGKSVWPTGPDKIYSDLHHGWLSLSQFLAFDFPTGKSYFHNTVHCNTS